MGKQPRMLISRRSCTCHPQGRNSYHAATGTKLIQILVSGSDGLDPPTCRIMR